MKILVLCYEYPPLGGGGGRVARVIAAKLAEFGHDVRVETAGLGWGKKEEVIDRVPVIRRGTGRRSPDRCSVFEMGAYLAGTALPLLSHAARWRPDVVHAHFAMPTGVLAWFLRRCTGIPYVLTSHLGDVPGGVPGQTDRLFLVAGWLARWVWRGAAAASAVSSFVQDLAERAYKRPVVRILNGIELGEAPQVQKRIVKRLLFVGRFNPQKNPLLLIDALALIPSVPCELEMIGDGELMPAVRDRIRDAGLEARITCTGWLDAAEVAQRMRGADLLCMPSTSEGMPVAGVEALRHGLAIVASDIPGVWDILADGVNGYRVPLGDAAAFAERIAMLCKDEAELARMQAASWEKAREFDLTSIAREYERMLLTAISSQ